MFDELRHGKTFSKTSAKHGKKKAEKQMVAIALSEGRKHGFHKPIEGEAKKLHKEHHGKGRVNQASRLKGKVESRKKKERHER
ncbi:MAG: hypothetical protein ACREQ5_16970 [Candidatus Dormibacteria bacterium]